MMSAKTSCFQKHATTGRRQTLIWVRTEPKVDDPREMKTILTCSLRSLWGDLEPHSCDLSVGQPSSDDFRCEMLSKEDSFALLVVGCRPDSVNAVRAAITLVTPPSYLEETLYQFDVMHVK